VAAKPASQPAAIRKPPARRAPSRKPGRAESSDAVIEIIRMAGLALLCLFIWCTVYSRVSIESWNVPLEYGINGYDADVQAELGGLKAARDGYRFPFVFHSEPHLNAPYIANCNDVPENEDVIWWVTGKLASVIGLFAAANFLVLAVQVFAALAFYYTARRLKCAWKWSFAGALFFALAPYAFAHSLHHVDVTSYWHIPLGLLVCFWVANGTGLRFRTRDYWIAIGVALIFGLQNVYYINIFVQLVGVSLIIRWMRHGWRNWQVCLVPLSIGTAAIVPLFLGFVRVALYALMHGHNAGATVRNYAQMEFYGLKLVDFFVPFPTHKLAAFANLGRAYEAMTILPAETPPACYFGLAVIAAFIWLAVYTVRAAIARPAKKVPLESVQVLWVFFYATVGGVNSFLGVQGFQLFRSTTRYCIVIYAITLLFAIRRLSIWSKLWPSPWPLAAPLAISVIGLWEILPPTAGGNIQQVSTVVDSDRNFAQTMEATLPKGGMVFQLPVMDFPESPIPGVGAYDHYRPYLYTHDLRYTYGTDKGRPDNAWQRVVGGMKPAAQVAALERYGFSGIYVNTSGYPDHGQALLDGYKAAGRTEVIQSPLKDLFCVVLEPSPNPELPPPGPFFASGWYAEQDSPNGQRDHLSRGNGVLILTNPSDTPQQKYATFYIVTIVPRVVTINGGGAFESWHVDQSHPAAVPNLLLTLAPGENRIEFTTDTPPSAQQMGPVSFGIVNFDLTDSPKAEQ
jgi:hypothetical protein